MKQNIREDQAKKSPPKQVKENARDPYDFWKTEVGFCGRNDLNSNLLE